MAGGSFQLGSIIATIRLDSKQFIKELEKLKKSVASIDIKWTGLKSFHTSAQNIIGKLNLVKNSAQGIAVSAKVFGKLTGNNLLKTANATNSGFLKLTGTVLKFANTAIPQVITGFWGLGKAAKGFFTGFFGWFKKFFLGPFAILQRSIFTWKNLIAVVLARAMITRAKDLETVSAGFDHLAASIGAVSGELLTNLRSATRGTVSDFRLMQTANSAVLLGVAQTGDELAEMAELARRLGKAVGRDAVAAFQDLSTGIGRQSRLILDNLGLQVRVQDAYETFRRQIGAYGRELTDAEKKQAFLNAAMDQARIKVRSLGPDILGVAEAWGVLEASVINAFDAFSKGFIGGDVASAIGEFINSNLVAIQGAGVTAKIALGGLVQGLFASLKSLLEENQGNLLGVIEDILKVVLAAALRIILNAIDAIVSAVIKVFVQHGDKIKNALIKIINAALYTITRTFVILFDKVTPVRLKSLLGFDKDETLIELDAYFGYVSERTKERIKQLQDDAAKALGQPKGTPEDSLLAYADLFVKENTRIRREQKPIAKGFGATLYDQDVSADRLRTEDAIARWLSLKNAVDQSTKSQRAHIELLDSVSSTAFSSITTGLQAMAEVMSSTGKDIEEDLFSVFGDKIPKWLGIGIDAVNGFFTEFTNLPRRASDEVAQFIAIITKSKIGTQISLWEKALRGLRNSIVEGNIPAEKLAELLKLWGVGSEQAVTGLDLTIKAVRKMIPVVDKAAQKLKDLLFPKPPEASQQGIKDLKALIDNLKDEAATQNLNDMELAIYDLKNAYETAYPKGSDLLEENIVQAKELREEIEGVTKELQDAAAAGAQLSIASGGVGGLRGEIAQLEFRQAQRLKGLTGDARQAVIDETAPELKLKKAEAQVKEFLESVRDGMQVVGDALVDAFARGEDIAKIWSRVVADIWRNQMSKAMNRIADTVQTQLGKVFAGLFGASGEGAGAAGVLAGLAGGLLTVVSGILSNLKSKSDTTIDDFGDSVTESEAVRGVVAGPTNVAISRVGSALKEALQTTEQLLLRIAIDLEEGTTSAPPPGSTRQPLNAGLSYNLSGSTVG